MWHWLLTLVWAHSWAIEAGIWGVIKHAPHPSSSRSPIPVVQISLSRHETYYFMHGYSRCLRVSVTSGISVQEFEGAKTWTHIHVPLHVHSLFSCLNQLQLHTHRYTHTASIYLYSHSAQTGEHVPWSKEAKLVAERQQGLNFRECHTQQFVD